MKIIESNIIGKKSEETCEDGLVVTDSFVSVIDGSTSKTSNQLSPDMKNGRYAMMLISEYIRYELKADATVDDFCQGVTQYIYDKAYSPLGIAAHLAQHPEERLTASAVVYSHYRKEIWMVGDCQAIVCGKLYDNPKPYEEKYANQRAQLILLGWEPSVSRELIVPLLVEEMKRGQNKTYAVVDGFPIFREGVKVVPIVSHTADASSSESNQPQDIILASDGYPFLKPTLAESEEALARLLSDDPQCVHDFKATKGLIEGNKSFDDRAYVRFSV